MPKLDINSININPTGSANELGLGTKELKIENRLSANELTTNFSDQANNTREDIHKEL